MWFGVYLISSSARITLLKSRTVDDILSARKMEPLSCFYHNTSPDCYEMITNDGLLRMNSLKYDQQGIFFCATLWNGNLPTISPYGDMRFITPVTTVMNMFENPHLYYCGSYY